MSKNRPRINALKRIASKAFHELARKVAWRLQSVYYKRRALSEGCYIDKTVHVLGWRNVRIGRYSVLSEDVWINVSSRIANTTLLQIGENTFIGRRNFFSIGKGIEIGSYCLTGPDCKFMGSDHLHDDPMLPIISTGVSLDKEIVLGSNCWLGASVSIVGSVRIGHGSVIGANAIVTSDLPPFCVAIGTPARAIKRYDFSAKQWVPADAYDSACDELAPSEAEYLKVLRAAAPHVGMPLHAAGRCFRDLP